jgi:hypothetical protein
MDTMAQICAAILIIFCVLSAIPILYVLPAKILYVLRKTQYADQDKSWCRPGQSVLHRLGQIYVQHRPSPRSLFGLGRRSHVDFLDSRVLSPSHRLAAGKLLFAVVAVVVAIVAVVVAIVAVVVAVVAAPIRKPVIAD